MLFIVLISNQYLGISDKHPYRDKWMCPPFTPNVEKANLFLENQDELEESM